jgi:hypothetical protein
MLGVLAMIATIGLGFGIVGLVYNAVYGFPLFAIGITCLALFMLLSGLTGRSK